MRVMMRVMMTSAGVRGEVTAGLAGVRAGVKDQGVRGGVMIVSEDECESVCDLKNKNKKNIKKMKFLITMKIK